MFWAFLTILVAGGVGGFAGNLARRTQLSSAAQKEEGIAPIYPDVVLGIVASFCVPIFLLSTQSKLIDSLKSDADTGGLLSWDLLYLFGFCLIAAMSARPFLESISGQLLKIKKNVKEIEANQEDLKDEVAEIDDALPPKKETEAAPEDTSKEMVRQGQGIAGELSLVDKRVLKALKSEKYARRSLTGISKDANISKLDALNSLARLQTLNLVSQGQSSRTGRLLYQLTTTGLSALGRST